MLGFILLAAASLPANAAPAAIAPAAARQQGSPGATRAMREVCYVLATSVIPLELDTCLSFDRATEPVFRAEVCNFLRETAQLEDYDFVSYAACLRSVLDIAEPA